MINHADSQLSASICPARRKALITGASRGIGAAIARKLASEQYDLYLTCLHSGEKLRRLAAELHDAYQIEAACFSCDAASAEQTRQLFRNIPALDVLINNAGISYTGLLSEMPEEDWQHVMDVNLNSVFYTSKQAVPLMLKQHSGRILNISSVWGSAGASMEVAYSASKGGVNAFTKALARELAPSGIQVNAISFGYIDTEMNAEYSAEEVSSIIEEIPADRISTPGEAASMVSCVLQMPPYTTGQIFTMDGGWQNC